MKNLFLSAAVAALLATFSYAGGDDISNSLDVNITTDSTTGAIQTIEYNILLHTGWNLIGIPGYKAYKPEEIFGQQDLVEQLYCFDPKGNWKKFDNKDVNASQISAMVPGKGCWVKAKSPFALSFASNIPSQSDTWEKAGVRLPNSDTLTEPTLEDMSDPVVVATTDYESTWTTAGTLSSTFSEMNASVDWNASKEELAAKMVSDWSAISMDLKKLLVGAQWMDKKGLNFRFLNYNDQQAQGKVQIFNADNKSSRDKISDTISDKISSVADKISDNASDNAKDKISDKNTIVGSFRIGEVDNNLTIAVSKANTIKLFKFIPVATETIDGVLNMALTDSTGVTTSIWKLVQLQDASTGEWVSASNFSDDNASSDVDWDTNESDSSGIDELNTDDVSEYSEFPPQIPSDDTPTNPSDL